MRDLSETKAVRILLTGTWIELVRITERKSLLEACHSINLSVLSTAQVLQKQVVKPHCFLTD